MADSAAYPYVTRLNIEFGPLERIDIQPIIDACKDQWLNQTLCKVNASLVRLGVIQGEYHWHRHDKEDEFFYVVDGLLLIDLDDRVVELGARQAFVVPMGVMHRTRAPQRTVILMVEAGTVVPTGN